MSETTTESGIVQDGDATPDGQSDADQSQSPSAESNTEGQEPEQGREAAKYRRKLRDAEKSLQATQGQLAELRRQVAEQAASALPKPAALWLNGRDVDSLYGEDGRLDPKAVEAAVREVQELLGVRDPDMGQGRRNSHGSTGNSVADAMLRRRKR